MGKLGQHTAPPLPDLSAGGSGEVCPECGHGDRDRSSWVDRLLTRMTGSVRVYECPHAIETMTDNCGCTNTRYHRPA